MGSPRDVQRGVTRVERVSHFVNVAFAISVAVASTAVSLAQAPVADPYGFDIEVALSPKAAAELAARHEQVTAYASYFGQPAPGAEKHVDEVGQIDLANQTKTVAANSGAFHFDGPAIDPRRLALIDGTVMVNLNVASARKSSEDNLLACDFIQGALADVRKAAITLHCGLISEDPVTVVKP